MTRLLANWSQGDHTALEKLIPLVYEQLRALAHHYMEGQRPDHTLQTTAVAAKAMRQVLVDHARAQQRQKRGAGLPLVYAWTGERGRALEQLEKVATLPGEGAPTTHGDLRFNPCCDDLRGDKRFDKIVAAAKAASRSFVTCARK